LKEKVHKIIGVAMNKTAKSTTSIKEKKWEITDNDEV